MGFFNQLLSLFRKKNPPLPIEEEAEPQDRRKRSRTNPKEETRILVIDDSPTILTAMKRFLDSAHCSFLGALDAKMGLEIALTQKPDLIFLDIVMPGINGFAALRALRKSSRTREIPIIMMSGNEQAKAQFFGAHIGADDFMKKPFSRFEVFARISRLLDANRIPRRPPLPGTTVTQEEPLNVHLADITPTPAPEKAKAAEVPPSDAKSDGVKSADVKPADVKSADAKPTDVKAADAKPADAKPSDSQSTVFQRGHFSSGPASSDTSAPAAKPAKAAKPKTPARSSGAPSSQVTETAATVDKPPRTRSGRQTKSAQPPAQVIPITPPPVQATQPAVSAELLMQIARLAQLAHTDPEALRALGVLAAQLAARLGTAHPTEAANQSRAATT